MTRFKEIAVVAVVAFDVFVGTSLYVPATAAAQNGYFTPSCDIQVPPLCAAGICNGSQNCTKVTIKINGKDTPACRCK